MRYDSVLLHVSMYLEHIYNSVIWVRVHFPLALLILVMSCVGEAGGSLERNTRAGTTILVRSFQFTDW